MLELASLPISKGLGLNLSYCLLLHKLFFCIFWLWLFYFFAMKSAVQILPFLLFTFPIRRALVIILDSTIIQTNLLILKFWIWLHLQNLFWLKKLTCGEQECRGFSIQVLYSSCSQFSRVMRGISLLLYLYLLY